MCVWVPVAVHRTIWYTRFIVENVVWLLSLRTKVVIKNNDKYKPSDSIFKKLVIDGFKKCKQNIKDSINNYKKIKEEYKNKKDSQN